MGSADPALWARGSSRQIGEKPQTEKTRSALRLLSMVWAVVEYLTALSDAVAGQTSKDPSGRFKKSRRQSRLA